MSTPLDARLRLDTAVRLLTEPAVADIARHDAVVDSLAAQEAREQRHRDIHDDEYEQKLVAKHADLLARNHAAQARRVLAALIAHRRTRNELAEQRRIVRAAVPALLDLVREAVESSSGGGVSAAGPNRAPIGLGAAELLHAIQRHTRAPADVALTKHVQTWAADVDDEPAAADVAEQWVEQARAIITPPKRWTHPGACPACGKSVAYVADESGQQVRRPALELDRNDAAARCLRCGATWKGEGQLRSRARVLEDEAG